MHYTLRAGLRVAGLMMMAIAIAHCGDNNNDDVNGTTPTPTPTATGPTRTPTPTVTSSGGTVTATVTPTPGPACPSAISFEGNPSVAHLDTGWTGLGHNAGIVDKGKITVAVTTCENSTRPCGVCNLSGPIKNRDANQNPGTADNQRCTNNTSVACTLDAACFQQCVGGQNDGAACTDSSQCPPACADASLCPSGSCSQTAGTCKFYFGAPLALSAGATSTCVVNEVNGPVIGTANIETGESASTANLIAHVFLGTLNSPCAQCVGDSTPEDGVRNGTCTDGTRKGLSCDVGGTHLNPYFGSTSFDCPLDPLGAVASLPIALANSTDTTPRNLSADSPNCFDITAAPGLKCFCDTCNTLAAEPCFTNTDCPVSGGAPGVCGGRRCQLGPTPGKPCTVNGECTPGVCSHPGLASRPNQCDDSTCSPLASDPNSGQCAGGPFEFSCGPNATFAGCFSGDDTPCAAYNRCTGGANDGFVGCAVASQCPGGTCEIQTCSVGKFRPCFLDNGVTGQGVTAVGAADVPVDGVSHPTLATLFCIGPTSSGAVNTAAGLPGLGRLQLGGTASERD